MEAPEQSEQPSRNVKLREVPPTLTVHVLKKMPQTDGLRMRQTEKYTQSLVEYAEVRFCPDENLFWLALCFDTKHNFGIHIGRLVNGKLEFYEIIGPLDFLGCMRFKTMFVVCGIDERYSLKFVPPTNRATWSEDIANIVIPILKRYRVECSTLRIHGICYTQMKQIMRLVSFQKLFDHSHTHQIDNVIALFNEGRFLHKAFDVFCNIPIAGLLTKIRDFDSVSLYKYGPDDNQEFAEFIRDCRIHSTGRLTKFTLSISHQNRATYIDEWPGCHEVWFGCISRFNARHVGQIHTFDNPSKLGVIFTEDWEWSKRHFVYFFDYTDRAEMARLTINIIKLLCPHIPVDGAFIYRELCSSSKAEIPFVITDLLNEIYSPPVMYPINLIRRAHRSVPDFLDY